MVQTVVGFGGHVTAFLNWLNFNVVPEKLTILQLQLLLSETNLYPLLQT